MPRTLISVLGERALELVMVLKMRVTQAELERREGVRAGSRLVRKVEKGRRGERCSPVGAGAVIGIRLANMRVGYKSAGP